MCDKQRRNAVLNGPNLLKEEQTTQVRGKKKVSSLVSGVEKKGPLGQKVREWVTPPSRATTLVQLSLIVQARKALYHTG